MKKLNLTFLFLARLLMYGGVLWVFSCTQNTAPDETEFILHNPSEFSEEVDSVEVYLLYGTAEVLVYSGKAGDDGFEGPWNITVTDFKGESIEIKVVTFNGQKESLGTLAYEYSLTGETFEAVSSLKFSRDTLVISLTAGSLGLEWNLFPEDLPGQVTAASSDEAILLIESNQSAQLLDTGLVSVFLSLADENLLDTLVVHIISENFPPGEIKPENIRFATETLSLILGVQDYPLQYTITPDSGSWEVECRTLNSDILKVSAAGLVTPQAEGSAIIICAIQDTTLEDSLQVTVIAPDSLLSLTSIALASDTLSVYSDAEPFTVSYVLLPPNSSPFILWSTSNGSVASVDEAGNISPLKPGTTWIKVLAAGDKVVTDSLLLEVTEPPPSDYPSWNKKTLRLSLSEGDSLSFILADSGTHISSASLGELESALASQASLTGGEFKFKAGVLDSGMYSNLLILTDAPTPDTLEVIVEVLPAYFSLTLNAENGSIETAAGKTIYRFGETATLTALPSTGYGFSSWSGDNANQSNPTEIFMDADKTITASFDLLSVLECIEVKSGESINATIAQVYALPAGQGTICPEAGGRFDNNTIGINGTVKILIR